MSRQKSKTPDANLPLTTPAGRTDVGDPDAVLHAAAPELVAQLSLLAEHSFGAAGASAREQLARALAAERGPTAWLRSRATATRMLLALAAVLLIVLHQLLFSRRADFHVYPSSLLLLAVAAGGAVIGLGVVVELWPLHRRALRPLFGTVAIALALLLPFILSIGPVHTAHPASLAGTGADFMPRVVGCFVYGTVFSAPLLVLLWALDRAVQKRRGAPVLAALVAGVAANVALLLHCAITDPAHIALGHATVGVILATAYVAIRAASSRPAVKPTN